MDNSAIAIDTTEASPQVKAHVDRVVVAEVAVGNDTSLSNTVVSQGDGLATQGVVLSSAELVEDLGGNSDEGRLLVYALEVGADAAGTGVAEDVVALSSVAKAEDGAVRATTGATLLVGRGSGSSQGQSGADDGGRELHLERFGWFLW